MKIEVSNGELLDKLSILEIKKENNLSVDFELEIVYSASTSLLTNEVYFLYSVLKNINIQLWTIEEEKRHCEEQKEFEDRFIILSRLVHMLNDERARIKKYINDITDSKITEKKSHSSVA